MCENGEYKESLVLCGLVLAYSFGSLMVLIMIGQGMLAGITINAVVAFGEELMWRGFLLKELKGKGIWRASLIIGSIWGIWHAPLII